MMNGRLLNPIRIFLLGLLLCLPVLASAALPLPADQAFQFSAHFINKNTLLAKWQIMSGYYLYRKDFSFSLTANPATKLGTIELPPGIFKQDDILGKYQVYQNILTIRVPVINPRSGNFTLTVGYQGCASSGFCYPPITKQLTLAYTDKAHSVVAITPVNNPFVQMIKPTNLAVKTFAVKTAPRGTTGDLLASHNYWLIMLSFFGFGLLLVLTPCVLPLLPILSGIIVGQGKHLTTQRAFFLSLTYVLAMAVTYALAGIVTGLAGSYVQAILQNAWVLGAFSLLFVLLALSLFGFYELRLPALWQEKITSVSNRQRSGTYIGVAIMGCLSVLIVSPCVTAPLIGALTYIGNTGNALLGGIALFTMGLGMGAPLLIVGTMGGKIMPKSGPWLDAIKAAFGVLLLGVAIWLLQRIVAAQIVMFLWSALTIISAVYLGAVTTADLSGWRNFWRGTGILLLLYGIAIFIGALQGNTDPLQPLAGTGAFKNPLSTVSFQPVKGQQNLQQALANAKAQNKPVMLDFYADWCVSCIQMQRHTFTDPAVEKQLQQFVLLRADVTANDTVDQMLEKQFNIIAPPAILFFNKDGVELSADRVVGEMSAEKFLKQLQQVTAHL